MKNIFELKHAQDVAIDGNVFENNWLAAQPGYSIVFTPRNQYNDNPWTVVQRVTFTNNIVRHVSSVFNILGWDNNAPSLQTNHITIRNNVFEDVSAANWGGNGRLMLISETPYVTVDHNTGFNSGSAIYAYNGPSTSFVVHQQHRQHGDLRDHRRRGGRGERHDRDVLPGGTVRGERVRGVQAAGGLPGRQLLPDRVLGGRAS